MGGIKLARRSRRCVSTSARGTLLLGLRSRPTAHELNSRDYNGIPASRLADNQDTSRAGFASSTCDVLNRTTIGAQRLRLF
jgi:hypothetical protein